MVDVFFATNRDFTGTANKPEFGNRFHEKGPYYLRYGKAVVDRPKAQGKDYTVRSVRLAKEKIVKDEEKRVLGSDEIFETVRERMASGKSDTIVLIHGYASTFEDALARGAEIKDRYQYDDNEPNVFVFSWPANGEMVPMISYLSDRQDARASGVAVARSILRLREYLTALDRSDYCRHSLHLVAHSMGNFALRHAVQGLRGELGWGDLPRMFDNVFLMAADEDNDTFEHDYKLRQLPNLARAVHIYYSPDDQALTISDVTKNNPDRLGSEGPRLKDNLPRKVTLVDCRSVDTTSLGHAKHQYYRAREEVWEDVRQVLADKLPGQIDGREYLADERAYRILSFKERRAAGG
ncbi:MAG: alpha/beta hydrolase [Alphaproteobacteria bacterium]|nr:alpha/beta hydrolase [Alphaproteobacteria bacterium]